MSERTHRARVCVSTLQERRGQKPGKNKPHEGVPMAPLGRVQSTRHLRSTTTLFSTLRLDSSSIGCLWTLRLDNSWGEDE